MRINICVECPEGTEVPTSAYHAYRLLENVADGCIPGRVSIEHIGKYATAIGNVADGRGVNN